jgi:hypothetical protein
LAEEDRNVVRCPICGAPYRNLIPTDALQLKCDYCGATFRTPPQIGVEIPECVNHPERYAVANCNDCGRSFCSECLHSYNLNPMRSDRAVLYLCPDCFKKRYLASANRHVFSGIAIITMGVIFTSIALPFALIILIGVAQVFYGFSQRGDLSQELGKVRQRPKTEQAAEPSDTEQPDAEKLYDELFDNYTDRWGTKTGAELLDDEIKAYTWNGASFAEAVNKVYERQKKKT